MSISKSPTHTVENSEKDKVDSSAIETTVSREVAEIFLVDDHSVVRRGLRALIEQSDGFRVVGEAASAEQALQAIPYMSPDLITVDLSLDGMNGYDLIRRLTMVLPELSFVVVSIYKSPSCVRRARGVGAAGYVSKDRADDILVPAITAVLEGRSFPTSRSMCQVE